MSKFKKFEIYCNGLNRNMQITLRFPDNPLSSKVNYLYMHDGQNVFDPKLASYGKAWEMDEHLTRLENEGLIKSTILVAIDSNKENEGLERCREYSLFKSDFILSQRNSYNEHPEYPKGILTPRGHEYLDFIVNDLIPTVETEKIDKRIMMGSSMGGLITHCAGILYPAEFDILLCLSNAYWYHDKELIEWINTSTINKKQKYYLDVGTDEESSGIEGIKPIYISTNEAVYEAMKKKTNNVELNVIQNGKHNEEYWSKRVEEVLIKYLKEKDEIQ